jgi:hypothetical protein
MSRKSNVFWGVTQSSSVGVLEAPAVPEDGAASFLETLVTTYPNTHVT